MISEIQKFFSGLLLVSIFHLGVWGQNEKPEQTTAFEKPGRILGRVFDTDSGEALQGVTVLVESSKIETKTDIEGRYRISNIAPGNYSLLFFKQNYQRTRVSVEGVESGRTKLVDLPLNPDYSDLETLDEFEITAEELAGTDIQLLSLRQESMVVMDAMGSFDMSRLGAGNVADALTKMVGTSVQDGKYVVVRGLADRYSNATFNGVPIPSSDVYRNTPQLDLFPSIAVDSISIKKSMSPELGAAFSGGSVDVVTKAYPEEFTLNVSVGTKYNEILFDEGKYLSYDDGSDDQWGFGLDARKLPENYQSTAFWSPSKLNPTNSQITDFMSGVDPLFVPRYEDDKLGRSIGFEFGNLIDKKDFSIGVMFSLDYDRSFSTKPKIIEQKHNFLDSTNSYEINPESSFEIEEGSENSEIGSYFQTSFIPNEENEIGLILLWSHTGEKTAKYSKNLWKEGINGEKADWGGTTNDTVVEGFELGWEERDMLLPQLYGKHILSSFYDWEVDWRLSKTMVSLDEPENRSIQRGWKVEEAPTVYWGPSKDRGGSQFVSRIAPNQIWRSMNDESNFYRLDLKSPEVETFNILSSFEFGFSEDRMTRSFDQTELELEPDLSDGTTWWATRNKNFYAGNAPAQFISPGPITHPTNGLDVHNYFDHPSYTNVLTYQAEPNGGDYDGTSKLSSIYFASDLNFNNLFKIRVGGRLEDYYANVSPRPDPEVITAGPYVSLNNADTIIFNSQSQSVIIEDKNIYPSISIAKDWDFGIKASISYGETTARPNFRELAYVETFDPITDSYFKGNPSLQASEIENYDIRFDWNLSEKDIFSLSLFYKEILNPIQATLGNTNTSIDYNGNKLSWGNGTDFFINSKSAEVYGVELELKKSLEEYYSLLEGFRIGGNLTWSQSEVSLTDIELDLFPAPSNIKSYNALNVADRMTRELEGQSEWIFTIDLSYENEDLGILSTIVYSYYGTRLNAAAYQYPEDLWEDGFSSLDFINSYTFGTENWKFKFSAKNLTAEDRIVRIRNTNAIRRKFQTPRIFSLSLEKSF